MPAPSTPVSDVVPRFFHAGGLLADGKVMVTGGLGLQIFPPSLYSRNDMAFYNPATGQFSRSFVPWNGGSAVTPYLGTRRSSHTQTALNDGRVLITGGNTGASGTSPGSPIASVEIFDPWPGTIGPGPAMAVTRADHTATLLPDGRVVVAGGGDSWQIFAPSSNTWSANYALARSRTAHAAVLLTNFAETPGDHRVLLIAGGGSGANTMERLNPRTGRRPCWRPR